jgi:hypothetical protein
LHLWNPSNLKREEMDEHFHPGPVSYAQLIGIDHPFRWIPMRDTSFVARRFRAAIEVSVCEQIPLKLGYSMKYLMTTLLLDGRATSTNPAFSNMAGIPI